MKYDLSIILKFSICFLLLLFDFLPLLTSHQLVNLDQLALELVSSQHLSCFHFHWHRLRWDFPVVLMEPESYLIPARLQELPHSLVKSELHLPMINSKSLRGKTPILHYCFLEFPPPSLKFHSVHSINYSNLLLLPTFLLLALPSCSLESPLPGFSQGEC